jgi:hypothetical protein
MSEQSEWAQEIIRGLKRTEAPASEEKPAIPPHWHYATAMPGYSSNAETIPSVTDVFDLATELAQELGKWEEFLREGMGICAEHDDAKGLLKEYKRLAVVETAAIVLGNIAKQRTMAFWADKEDRLAGNVLTFIGENFPLVVSHNNSLEVWRCDHAECEHWRGEG